MTMSSTLLDTALQVVKEAASNILLPAFTSIQNYQKQQEQFINNNEKVLTSNPINISTKSSDIDLVTETDQAVQKYIFEQLYQRLLNPETNYSPRIRFIGEETVQLNTDSTTDLYHSRKTTDLNNTWVLDPIDGTANFVHGNPNFAISLAYFDQNGELSIGIIHAPALDLLYWGEAGKGAFKNGMPLHTIAPSNSRSMQRILMAYEPGSTHPNQPFKVRLFDHWLQKVRPLGIRSSGSSALNLARLADGELGAYFDFGMHIWDIAAGLLLVQEAGGSFVNAKQIGDPIDFWSMTVCAASSPQLARELQSTSFSFIPSHLKNDLLLE